ncbi:MAG: hypothetical protein KatS3mg077_0717 [Candidatus Binatia bacterium]|nr:MAG: hypothetical protein KatS3mg077_0717 [Candidatus Binatia bacterium]
MAKHTKMRTRCVYCGSQSELTVDHVIPISRWRDFRLPRRVLDNKSNKVVACKRCNHEKGNLAPREWFQLHPDFYERFRREAKYLSNAVKSACGLD